MSLLSQSVPVTLADSWGGLASNTGLLRLEKDVLVLEFETKDGILEVLRSGIQRLSLPLSDVEACTWRPGWFSPSIEIFVRRLECLGQVPGAEQGKLMLGVARRDRQAASALVTNVNLALAHHVVRAVEEATDSPRSEA